MIKGHVWTSETGLVRTVVVQSSACTFEWRRTYHSPDAVTDVLAGPRLTIAGAGPFAAPIEASGRVYRWLSSGDRPLASVARPPWGAEVDDLESVFRQLGRDLRAFHHIPLDGGAEVAAPVPPPWVQRLRGWLGNSLSVGSAQAEAVRFRQLVGPTFHSLIRDQVESWCELPDRGASVVLLHGGFSLASIPWSSGSGGTGPVLVGPEVTRGVPETDLGTLAGELAEHAWVAALSGAPAEPYLEALSQFLEGYGARYDRALADVVLMRILGHLTDFSAFVGPIPEWDVYTDVVRNLWSEPLTWQEELREDLVW